MLLTANVAFLALPSVDLGKDSKTSAQVASYASIITSIGSILTGLLLIRYRFGQGDTLEKTVRH